MTNSNSLESFWVYYPERIHISSNINVKGENQVNGSLACFPCFSHPTEIHVTKSLKEPLFTVNTSYNEQCIHGFINMCKMGPTAPDQQDIQ